MPNIAYYQTPVLNLFAFSRFLIFLFICVNLIALPTFAEDSASTKASQHLAPKAVVEHAATQMIDRLIADKEKVINQEYYVEHLVEEVLLPVVDHVYMARRVLAKHWRKASDAQKKQFVEAFKHKVIRTYAGAFKAFDGEKIEFQQARFNKSGSKASVETSIQRVGAPAINVTYMLYSKNNRWLTYDAVIEGVSLVKSFRDQFSLSIERHGLAQAISMLAAEYSNESPTLKLGGQVWDPYINNQLPAGGLVVNLVTAVLERAGYQVEMQYMPWQRVAESIAEGELDISIASWHNETRAKEMEFTDAYLNNQLVIVKRKDDPLTFNNQQEFKQNITDQGYRLGVFKDYGYGDFFAEVAPLVSLNYFKYCSQMIRDVAQKKTDLALIDSWTAQQSLKTSKNISQHISILPTALIEQRLHAAISLKRKDHKEIAIAFNESLKEMREDGSYQALLERHDFPQELL